MPFALVAILSFNLRCGEGADLLPTRMSLDEPVGRPQHEEPLPERPSNLDAARIRRDVAPDAWTIRVAPTLRYLLGKTRVREKDSRPSWLETREDLGIAPTPGLRLDVEIDTGSVRWFLGVDFSHTQGQGHFDRAFSYDEGNFAGNVPFRTRAELLFVQGGVLFPGAILDRPGLRISPFVGLEYVRLNVGISQSATGAHSSEQYHQFMPYPIAGVAAELRLSGGWKLTGRFSGGGLPEVPTLFLEGGRLSMRALAVNAGTELSWEVSETVRLFAGVGYQLWRGRLTSIEDDNAFRFQSPVFSIGLEIGW